MNLAGLMYYMKERESIRLKKESGQPKPWTADPILQKFKFTNVKRENDRTTRQFVEHYREHYHATQRDAAALLYNCAVARYFGTWEFKQRVGWCKRHDAKRLANIATKMLADGEKVFTGAYIITNSGQPGPKHRVVIGYLGGLWRAARSVVEAMHRTRKWEAGYAVMTELPGFRGSGFMTKEVLQDFLLAWPERMTDEATWTPMGPGARRGINRLIERPLNYRQPEAAFIADVQEVHAQLALWWSEQFPKGGQLTAHDVQFCLCEFDKYERVRLGQGRPRSRYPGAA